MLLNKQELIKVEGGVVKAGWILSLVSAGVTFIIGLLDGFTRPLACNYIVRRRRK